MTSNGIDFRVIGQNGFIVATKIKSGLSSRGIGQSNLTKGVGTKQAA